MINDACQCDNGKALSQLLEAKHVVAFSVRTVFGFDPLPQQLFDLGLARKRPWAHLTLFLGAVRTCPECLCRNFVMRALQEHLVARTARFNPSCGLPI